MLPVLAAVMLCCVVPAYAQAPQAATLDVQAGYDGMGAYVVGHWFPLAVTVTNSGGDAIGALRWTTSGDSVVVFEHLLDLPQGARKRILLPILSNNLHSSGTVTLNIDGQPVARQRVRLSPISIEQPVIGVISADATVLASLRAIEFVADTPTVVIRLDPELLPDNATLLMGLQALFIHDLATERLTDAQREALLLWTRLGGQLIVGGGPQAERTVAGLADALPVDVGPLRAGASGASLAALARRSDLERELPTLTVNTVQLRGDGRFLDADGLLSARSEGAGQVIFAAFDLAALRGWPGEPNLWQQALRHDPRAHVGWSFRWRSENPLRPSLQSELVWFPPWWLMLLLILSYIVVVGPLNFLLLHRLRRRELAWVTTPMIAMAAIGLTYGASLMLRGAGPQVIQLAIVQGFEGATTGQATAFFGIYSPQRRSYRVDFDPTSLVWPVEVGSFTTQETVTGDGVSNGMRNLQIDISELQTIAVEQTIHDVPSLESDLQWDGRRLSGEVRLHSGSTLYDAYLVNGAAAQSLGDVRPGAVIAVDLQTQQENFPGFMVSINSRTVFSHSGIILALFGFDRFSQQGMAAWTKQGHPDSRGVYLIGWLDRPTLPVMVDGAKVPQRGETLLIMRLKGDRP